MSSIQANAPATSRQQQSQQERQHPGWWAWRRITCWLPASRPSAPGRLTADQIDERLAAARAQCPRDELRWLTIR